MTSFADAYTSPAGTSRVSSFFDMSRGPEGNPTTVNTMPAVNVGTTSASTSGSTGSLCDPGVSALPGSSSTLSSFPFYAGHTDLSKIQVTISVDNLIT